MFNYYNYYKNRDGQPGNSHLPTGVEECVSKRIITMVEAQELTIGQKETLSKGGVRYALENKLITLADLGSTIKMDEQRHILSELDKNVEIEGQAVSLTSLLNVEWPTIGVLKEPGIIECLQDGTIKADKILKAVAPDRLIFFKKNAFSLRCVVEGIARQKLEIEQVLGLNYNSSLNLGCADIEIMVKL